MEYIGKYYGTEIYGLSFNDFMALGEEEKNTKDKIYMIAEDHRAIKEGMVFGIITENHKRLDTVPNKIHWTIAYAKQKKEWEDASKVEADEQVISERISVESLAREGEKKLNNLRREGRDKIKKVDVIKALE